MRVLESAKTSIIYFIPLFKYLKAVYGFLTIIIFFVRIKHAVPNPFNFADISCIIKEACVICAFIRIKMFILRFLKGLIMDCYKTVLFDLDGTLLKTKPGIIWSLKKALSDLNLPIPPEDKLNLFLGPPLFYCFTDICGLTPELADKASVIFRKYYETKGLYNATVYDGIIPLLKRLREKGYRLGIATSKSDEFAKAVVRHFGLAEYFDSISGSPEDSPTWTKTDSILSVISSLGSDKKSALMVGDRKFDIEGAKKAGVDCIGVLYGYGSREELSSCSPMTLAKTPADIEKYV